MAREPGAAADRPTAPKITGTKHPGEHPQVRVTPDCPVQCLQAALSLMSLNRLAVASGAWFEPPRTVADVLDLHRQRKLRDIRGLGHRRISEIEAALVFLGLDISGHHHR